MPGDGHWKPGGHHVHCELFTFAACPENVPGGHSSHDFWPNAPV